MTDNLPIANAQCQNPEFKGEDAHLLYCMNCDDCYLCTEEHSCDTHCLIIGDAEEVQ